MKRKPIDSQSKSVPKLVALITATPGMTSMELCRAACYSYPNTKNALSVIVKSGFALPVPRSTDRVWYLAEQARPLLEQWEKTRRKRGAPKPKQATKRDKIHALSMEPGGVSMAQIMEACRIAMNNGGRHVLKMVEQKRIFRGVRAGARLRWFDTAERAAEWAAMPAMEPSEWSAPRRKAWAAVERKPKPQKAPKLVAIGERIKNKTRQPSKAPPLLAGSQKNRKPNEVIRAKPGIDATVTLHGKATDMRGTVDYSRAKITICPAPVSIYRHEYNPTSEAHRAYVRQIEQLRGAA